MVGRGKSSRRRKREALIPLRASRRRRAFSSPMSAPDTKAFSPAPVRISTSTSSREPSSSKAAESSRVVCRSMALRASGRSMVTTATRSDTSTRIRVRSAMKGHDANGAPVRARATLDLRTMKAMVFTRYGGPEVLEPREIPDPAPAPGEVVVRVKACALNHLDLWVRKGLPGLKLELPHVLGADIAGVVEWSDTPGVPAGMEVLLSPGISCGRCEACLSGRDNFCRSYSILGEHRAGGYAGRIRVPAANVLPKPTRLSFVEAAAVPLVFLTAWHMLVERAALKSGEWVLVHAAGSGVGSAAVQIARLLGATVIATARGEKKLEAAGGLGAEHLVDSGKQDF